MTHGVAFTPGLTLSRLFFEEVIRPILEREFPALGYSASLVGSGSEVLGFDTEQSTDHDWGPRVQLFLGERDFVSQADMVRRTLEQSLPSSFRGYPFPPAVTVETAARFFGQSLGFDFASESTVEPADWLTFPQQILRALTSGAVFHDTEPSGDTCLAALRERLAYYPHDIWLYLMAAQWTRIGQEEHLAGRAGQAGDEIGSALIASRLVHDLMSLCFLMERQYAPYSKWFGTAFSRLSCAPQLSVMLRGAQLSPTWQERERHLVGAQEIAARMHNALGITEPLSDSAQQFHDRPFRVIGGEQFAAAIRAKITDTTVRAIAELRLIGSIDQISDNTDLLVDTVWRKSLRNLYLP